MKCKIEINEYGLDISVTDVKGKKDELIEAFQECQEGRCSCPTEEYKKLDSLDIEDNSGNIKLCLRSKDGLKIDKNEINKCLEFTKNRIVQKDAG